MRAMERSDDREPGEGLAPPPRDPLLGAILAFASFLILWNLGRDALWTDEAESACLSKAILEHGLPVAFDGENYVSQWVVAFREDFNDDLVWVLTPWLQLYVAAGSFAILGPTTWAARLPFALVGILCVWMLYRLAWRLTADRTVARWSAGLLTTCIPFLLHARQCRYYTFAMFATLWAVHAYLGMRAQERNGGMRAKKRGSTWQLVVACAILFHGNYGLFLPLAGALGLHALLTGWGKLRPADVAFAILGVAALTAPWALYAKIYRTSSRFDPQYVWFNLSNYLHAINNYALPLLVPVLWALLRILGRWKAGVLRWSHPGWQVLGLLIVLDLAFVSTNVGLFTRYIIILVPPLVMLNATMGVWIARGASERFGLAGRAAWLLLPLCLVTTLPALPVNPLLLAWEDKTNKRPFLIRPAIRRPKAEMVTGRHEIFDLFTELFVDVKGPVEGLVDFFERNADPGDEIYMDYGDVPALFYLGDLEGVEIRGINQGIPYFNQPDWVVSRHNRRFEGREVMRTSLLRMGYEPIAIEGFPDTYWQNRPDPYAHSYRTASLRTPEQRGHRTYPPVSVFKHPDKELKDATGCLRGAAALQALGLTEGGR